MNGATRKGLASSDAAQHAKREYDRAMLTQLAVGALGYCDIQDAAIEMPGANPTLPFGATRTLPKGPFSPNLRPGH